MKQVFTAAFFVAACAAASAAPRVANFVDDTHVEIVDGARHVTVAQGERYGRWTLVALAPPVAVFEDFTTRDGRIQYLGREGLTLDLAKSAEPTFATEPPYLGHTLDEVRVSATDLLANELLKGDADPSYARVAAAIPPIRRVAANVYSFVGTPDTFDKVPLNYGGRSPNFDPAVFQASIRAVRDAGKVWDGTVGGYLPILRFVYPESEKTWSELLVFAPYRIVNGNDRVQPVWYRVSRIEDGVLKWMRHVDTYLPYPPRADGNPGLFYGDLERLKLRVDTTLGAGMRIDIPDVHLANLARFSLLRVMATRIQDYPKYGVVETNYGGSEHDGFPDTFNVETAAFIEWGMLDRAAHNIDNYFGHFVRDDGSIVYRGPETGQFGRMLTVLAQFANAGGDVAVLQRNRVRIDALTRVLLGMRDKANALPATDPAHGLIAGWSEADAVLDPDPQRYLQPYFSNTTEAARGFRDLGNVWRRIGDAEWGGKLVAEAEAMRRDLAVAFGQSQLTDGNANVLPAIAGVKQPFHIAVVADRLDPQHRSYRAYMEMLHSGSLSREQVGGIVAYRARHHDTLLGIPTAYGYDTGEVAGFLAYGHGYGLIQHDFIRQSLLLTYSLAAHQYTRGTWLAPETRQLIRDTDAAPYCTPAQLSVPLLLKWLLVFEDPENETLWLAKGAPRDWLTAGNHVEVTGATTRWGRVGYRLQSNGRRIEARVDLPAGGITAETRLRMRAAGPMKSVTMNGKRWDKFDAAGEFVTIPANTAGPLTIVASY